MATMPMRLERAVWDNTADTVTLTLVDTSPPPPPPPDLPGGWYPGPGASVTITVPSRRAAETPRTAIGTVPQPDGTTREVRYEWTGTAWRAVQ